MIRSPISPEDAWYDTDANFRACTGSDPLAWQVPYLAETRDSAVLKGRQVGCSTAGAATAIRYARFFPRFLAAIVSPSQKQSAEVKLRARDGLDRLREPLVRDAADIIELANGSRIMSLPGSPKSVRGWSADLLIIDEAAFLEPQTFLAARATVAATGGRTIVQSTPAAPFGPFYELYSSATPAAEATLESGHADPTIRWVSFHVSSEQVSTISGDFLASERAKLSPEEYAQEYLGEFGSPGLGLVDPARLKELTGVASDPADPWAVLR